MTDIYELTATAIATLGEEHAADAYVTDEGVAIPDLYIVYTEVTGTPRQHADDAETERFYRMQVSIFCRDGLVGLPDVERAMIAQGFNYAGDIKIPYNDETRHFGLAKDFTILINQ
jgi:hypothetical protein